MTDKKKKSGKSQDPLDTPVMRQYLEIKDAHPDTILFFRMGDFYELFLDDAVEAAPLMDVALTRRQNQIPMAGVPYHSANTYLSRLLNAGKKVAVAEQKPDPENPNLMRRVVERVLTPGTIIEDGLLSGAEHRYLMAIAPGKVRLGIALADISTGTFFCQELDAQKLPEIDAPGLPGAVPNSSDNLQAYASELRDLFYRYQPREILLASDWIAPLREILGEVQQICTAMEAWKASPTEGKRQIKNRYDRNLHGLGFPEDAEFSLGACALVMHYVRRSFPTGNFELEAPIFQRPLGQSMQLDEQTIRNLDLIINSQEGGTTRSLFGVVDFCLTSPGKRFLKEALLAPLLDRGSIETRQAQVQALTPLGHIENSRAPLDVSPDLVQIHDLERILTRMAAGRAAPRDFANIRESILAGENLSKTLKNSKIRCFANTVTVPTPLQKLASELLRRVLREPPAVLGGGDLIATGVSVELDQARAARDEGSRWMAEFEANERKRTGISTLRVKYNRVAGYFIEMSKTQAKDAPEEYRRKQTLTAYERYTSDQLNELQQTLLDAEGKITALEAHLFQELCDEILQLQMELKALVRELAHLDFLQSLARAAYEYNWHMPVFCKDRRFTIQAGRHPVVEKFLPTGSQFIANDCLLDDAERSFAILTGPNMAGKSTYIRQVALIQLLAQMGSAVPAGSAHLHVVDRIFTRIGAHDNLTRGESTFFVEMLETARILNQATNNSLVVMDEVGRGTSTYDGLSIAWSIVEFLTDPKRCPLTLFATHYHELTELANRSGVFNLTMDVREIDGRVLFLHSIREGAADRSYGIHVARLAGLPEAVVARAEKRLAELESKNSTLQIPSNNLTKNDTTTEIPAASEPFLETIPVQRRSKKKQNNSNVDEQSYLF